MAECHLGVVSMGWDGWGRGEVHLRAVFGRDVGERWVLEDAAVEELHDVEVGAHDAVILA
jgi:hypothetical protein